MRVIGLCGGSGSGKTTVAKLFLKHGFIYIDTDEVYHALTSVKSPCLDALVSEFGNEILTESGALDRKRLASLVFADGAEEKRKTLNKIAHYYVLLETERIISQTDKAKFFGAIVDAPLLFESHLSDKCDWVIAVIADKSVRIKRICERDGISESDALRRISAQLSDEFLKENADYIIVNNGEIEALEKEVSRAVKKIKEI